MDKLLWIILAFAAGALLPVQAGLNAQLSKAAQSPVHASAISFVIGTAALMLYLVFTQQMVSWKGLKEAPWHVWCGGLLGAFYVTVIILVFPKLGPGLSFGLIVAGQMLFSLLLEHYNILVIQPHPVTIGRIIGMCMIIAGVIVMKKF